MKKTGKKIFQKGLCLLLGWNLVMSPVITGAEDNEIAIEEQADESRQELAGLGISYEYTDDMAQAGIVTAFSDYSVLRDLGIFNIRTDLADMYYVLVYPEAAFQEEAEEDHWPARFIENYPNLEYKEEANGEYHYTYLDLTACLDASDYSEEDWKVVEQQIPFCKELADSILYTDLEIEGVTFDSVNLDGDQVTDAIFGEKKITVLNIWATFCNPCINEMPELAKWEQELGEDAQIIYLCSDIKSEDSENIALADTIAEKTGVNRKNVIFNLPGTCTELVMNATAVPTTFFVDQDGQLLEEMVVGAYVDQYKQIVEKYLSE